MEEHTKEKLEEILERTKEIKDRNDVSKEEMEKLILSLVDLTKDNMEKMKSLYSTINTLNEAAQKGAENAKFMMNLAVESLDQPEKALDTLQKIGENVREKGHGETGS